MQEVSTQREIEIPEPVRDIYKQWRPSPLYRARRLEKVLGTPARIYYKYEGVSPAGSHKPTPLWRRPSITSRRASGRSPPRPEPASGDPRSPSPEAVRIEIKVFMVRVSYNQKPYRRALMETYGATCVASPSAETQSGRAILEKAKDHPGSLGIAISEAVEVAATHDDTKYALGSVLNHVLMHQTVLARRRWRSSRMAGDEPGRAGRLHRRRLQFAGLVFPFLARSYAAARSAASWRSSPRPARA